MSRLKILFVITGLNQWGAGNALYKLIRTLNRDRFATTVISLKDSDVFSTSEERVWFFEKCYLI